LGFVTVLANLLGNILIFVPFGFVLPFMYKRCRSFLFMTLLTFEVSLVIEVVQLITRVGIFDVDDLLLNTIGGMVGYMLFRIFDLIRRKANASSNKKKGKKL
jgi:glycopeptide antibiotics resistance protein